MEENALIREAPDPNAGAVGLALRGEALPAAPGPAVNGYAPVWYRGRVAWVRGAKDRNQPAAPERPS